MKARAKKWYPPRPHPTETAVNDGESEWTEPTTDQVVTYPITVGLEVMAASWVDWIEHGWSVRHCLKHPDGWLIVFTVAGVS